MFCKPGPASVVEPVSITGPSVVSKWWHKDNICLVIFFDAELPKYFSRKFQWNNWFHLDNGGWLRFWQDGTQSSQLSQFNSNERVILSSPPQSSCSPFPMSSHQPGHHAQGKYLHFKLRSSSTSTDLGHQYYIYFFQTTISSYVYQMFMLPYSLYVAFNRGSVARHQFGVQSSYVRSSNWELKLKAVRWSIIIHHRHHK